MLKFQKFEFKFKLGSNPLHYKNNQDPVRFFNLYLLKYSKVSLKNICTAEYQLLFLLMSFSYNSFISNRIPHSLSNFSENKGTISIHHEVFKIMTDTR